MAPITITRIPTEQSGDWHDRPIRYAVAGPGSEVQKFSTKREAAAYATDRRRSETQADAIMRWARRS